LQGAVDNRHGETKHGLPRRSEGRGGGIRVKMMNAALVIGMSGTKKGVPEIFARTTACSMKPQTQAATRGSRQGRPTSPCPSIGSHGAI